MASHPLRPDLHHTTFGKTSITSRMHLRSALHPTPRFTRGDIARQEKGFIQSLKLKARRTEMGRKAVIVCAQKEPEETRGRGKNPNE